MCKFATNLNATFQNRRKKLTNVLKRTTNGVSFGTSMWITNSMKSLFLITKVEVAQTTLLVTLSSTVSFWLRAAVDSFTHG